MEGEQQPGPPGTPRSAVRREMVACPPGARVFRATRRVRLGDVTRHGRLRLDALACYLQDVADDDAEAAGLPGAWVLRWVVLEVGRLPQFRDDVELVTFCSGTGPSWAERRTTLRAPEGGSPAAAVEAVALWVLVDHAGRPARLDPAFGARFGDGARRRVGAARLRHPPPPISAPAGPWPLRTADFDVLGHVNNALAWAAVEDAIASTAPERGLAGAEIEYREPIEPGDEVALVAQPGADRLDCWLVARPAGGAPHDGTPRVRVTARVCWA